MTHSKAIDASVAQKLEQPQVETLIAQLENLLQQTVTLEKQYAAQIKKVHPAFKESSKNLLHYLALRKHDIRDIQRQLSGLGLSSLGRAEPHVQATLRAVLNQLKLLRGHLASDTPALAEFLPIFSPLKSQIDALLGPQPPDRNGRIMVTFSSDLAQDYQTVRELLKAGMNCARINCAHDDAATWAKMVKKIRKAEKELGLPCKILFDLMGPKLRTGPMKPGPEVLPIHPVIDEVGQIMTPAKVWLAPPEVAAPSAVNASLAVSAEWAAQLKKGDEISFLDTRRRKRIFVVVQKKNGGALVHLLKSAYISTGTELTITHRAGKPPVEKLGKMPSLSIPLLLKEGQELILHRESIPGEAARYAKDGSLVQPSHISCTLPEVFTRVKPGEPILFDDGEIGGVIEEVHKDFLKVKITAADVVGSKLKPDKGINLPESDLALDRLTVKDREDLAFVVQHADIVNLSFVSSPEMVEELQAALDAHQSKAAIMLKIETKAAFSNLPHLLLTLMRRHPAGIMIARGDLAVELGWQRLAEVQEEILWITEAAHLPVVWATQVLEKLNKKGRPSRAEITDAAMAQRADCVMLNKGPHILKSIGLLADIMKRMQEHQYKKTSLLRMLRVSDIDGRLE